MDDKKIFGLWAAHFKGRGFFGCQEIKDIVKHIAKREGETEAYIVRVLDEYLRGRTFAIVKNLGVTGKDGS